MSLGRVLIASGTRWRRVSHPSIRSWRPISYSMLRCETMKEASVSRVTWNTVVDALTYPSSGGTHVLRRARYPQQTHFALRAQRDGASRPPRPGTDDRRDDANPRGPARSLRGLLRGELRVRPLPRLAAPAGRVGPGRASRSTAVDLAIKEQERPQRRGAPGEVTVLGGDADGACTLARGKNLA